MKINGSTIQAYLICHRQAWLLSHQLIGDQYNEFLAIGRLLSEETYKREKKEILINGNKIDVIKEKNGILTLIETKKSSKGLEASKIQLLNYLYTFSKKGYKAKGEIRIPKEKKVIAVSFGEKEKQIIEALYTEISDLMEANAPPEKEWLKVCKTCSYAEFCWS